MKSFFIFSILTLLFFGCTEIAPVVPALGDRKVLIEEFTGVRCVNCPAGAAEIENLRGIYGDRLVVVSIHAGDFAPPYSDSKYDFRTPEGTDLEKKLGAPLGYPSAVVNRKKISGQSELQVGRSQWAGLIAEESKQVSLANFAIQKTYNATNRQLQATLKIVVADGQKLPDDAKISAMLTESDITDAQETPQGKKSDYKHKYVLRAIPVNEQSLNTANELTFTTILKANWKEANCRLVVVLHRSGVEKVVLQVTELGL